jgi:hypothetical protein
LERLDFRTEIGTKNPEINGRIIGENVKKAKKSLWFFLSDDFDDTRSKV